MIFKPQHTDYQLSPYTGLTRESWIEAAEYLLRGIFGHIKSFDDPVVMPRRETAVTYPHSENTPGEQMAERLEGLARSFFIAAPLIHENPQLTVCGYCVRDYYKAQILRACTRGDALYVGHYEELQRMTGDTARTFQQTVETSALAICLWACRDEIWAVYKQEERDRIAGFLSGYAHGNTVPQNWRLFNMLDMAFLANEGYAIDEEIMLDHAQSILSYYAGDGWYRDGHSFDYYSCWAFQVYAPLWNLWYGYEHAPYLAAKFEEYSNRFMKSYADFFDRDGFVNMWGRSNIYRNAATSAFEGNFFLKAPAADPGLARRICSGALLQFFGRGDVLWNGIPTLGFYGQFTPLVQNYSCAESPFWLGKVFLCLHLPQEHPFWTAREHNGTWEKLRTNEVKETVLDGPALCVTDHGANGAAILRTGKVLRKTENDYEIWNYAKLCYHTKYPWESAPAADVESQQYVLTDGVSGKIEKCNVTLWGGRHSGVLYRRQFFDYGLDRECHWMHAINLADFPVACGIVRVDKLRAYRAPVSVTLGSYGFPDNGTKILRLHKGDAQAIVLKGKDSLGNARQMAMTVYDGWDELEVIRSCGTNPDSEHSLVIYARMTRRKQYGYAPYCLISQVITKDGGGDFSQEELFPIARVDYTDAQRCGGYGPVTVALQDGDKKVIDFDSIEGCLSI